MRIFDFHLMYLQHISTYFEQFSQILIDFLLDFYVINIKIGLHNDYNLFSDIVTENVLKS